MSKRKRKKRRSRKPKLHLSAATIQSVLAVIFIVIGLLIMVSLTGQGALLNAVYQLLSQAFGASYFFLAFLFIAAGLMFVNIKANFTKPNVLLGALFTFIGFMGAFHTGYLGESTYHNVANLLADAGAYILFIALMISGLFILAQMSWGDLVELIHIFKPKAKSRLAMKDRNDLTTGSEKKSLFHLPKLNLLKLRSKPKAKEMVPPTRAVEQKKVTAAVESTEPSSQSDQDVLKEGLTIPAASQIVWQYPPLSLLKSSTGGQADRGDVKKNSDIIESTLESFGIQAKIKEVNAGPSITQYALQIKRGTKLSKITSLANDLALHLAAPTGQIRIEAPIAGRDLIGIEVPNYRPEFVTLRHMLEQKVMIQHPSKLAVALGLDVSNRPVVADIAAMPHMLIAGATGSGKSVAINSFLTSILFRASPAEVRFILVDPKRVELSNYDGIPHLLTPVIVEPKKVVSALKWAVNEMQHRYKQLQTAGVRKIDKYNELAGYAAMYKIVIVIDELADIMLFAPGDVEESVTRLAQLARAVGIHLVLATQRPSVDVLTGLIKANIPARIAFNVSSMTDSRVILDSPGAEKLLGRGDMLFLPPDKAKPSRIQGTFVADDEIKNLIEFIKSHASEPDYKDEITTKFKPLSSKNGVLGADGEERDQLFLEVAKFVVTQNKASSSMVQRRFSVGYNRAARILDQLHAAGLCGAQEGSKARTINAGRIMEFIHQQEGTK